MGTKIELNPDKYWEEARKARFAAKVVPNEQTGCWEWNGSFFKNGRGQFYWGLVNDQMKNMSAHRAAWLLFVGPIPEDQQVLHKCNNPKCVRPDAAHIYLGDHARNMLDRHESGRTSRGAHRYNYRRTQELILEVIKLRTEGLRIEDICTRLNMGRSTYYRIAKAGLIDSDVTRAAARTNYRKAALER